MNGDNQENTPQVEEQTLDISEDVSTQGTQTPDLGSNNPINWVAQEYIHPEKTPSWYVVFVLAALALIAIDVFVFKSWTFSLLVIVMSVALVVYSRRPPKDVQYTLSISQGLYVGDKLYDFNDYKSFGVIKDGEHHSIMLIPTKRFGAGLSVYFPEDMGEQIVDILGSRLPMETLKLDAIDIIVRKLGL